MTLKRSIRWRRGLCLLLAGIFVFGCAAVVLLFPGRCYLFFDRHQIHLPLALEKEPTDVPRTRISPEELQKDPRVTVTNTLLLVNAAHPLPADYQPMLTEYRDIELHPQSVNAYVALASRVERLTGDRLLVVDDYRTRAEQKEIFASSPEGVAAALGCSEHEAGLALDVAVKGFGGQSFLKTWAGIYTNLFCSEYGFIIRYPQEKEHVTGISYEPWHLRYVGKVHARLMARSGLTLEEYLDALTPGVWYRTGETLICRASAEGIYLPDGWSSCEISPDNCGYYVVTLQMK